MPDPTATPTAISATIDTVTSVWPIVLSIIGSAAAAFLGAFAGYVFQYRRDRRQHKRKIADDKRARIEPLCDGLLAGAEALVMRLALAEATSPLTDEAIQRIDAETKSDIMRGKDAHVALLSEEEGAAMADLFTEISWAVTNHTFMIRDIQVDRANGLPPRHSREKIEAEKTKALEGRRRLRDAIYAWKRTLRQEV